MDKRAYDAAEEDGLLESQAAPYLEHLTERGKKEAWSQVERQKYDLGKVDFSKANQHCGRCNGTGIIRHAKIGGQLTTIICSCLSENEGE